MKITVEHNGTKIIIDESDNNSHKDRQVTMRYSDQNKQIQETIKVMVEQVAKLTQSNK